MFVHRSENITIHGDGVFLPELLHPCFLQLILVVGGNKTAHILV